MPSPYCPEVGGTQRERQKTTPPNTYTPALFPTILSFPVCDPHLLFSSLLLFSPLFFSSLLFSFLFFHVF
jgi:hypothetical protein